MKDITEKRVQWAPTFRYSTVSPAAFWISTMINVGATWKICLTNNLLNSTYP